MSDFHPLEVVDRCSETQLQAGENLNSLIYRCEVLRCAPHYNTLTRPGRVCVVMTVVAMVMRTTCLLCGVSGWMHVTLGAS